jgi:hypothetical protein
MKNHAKTDKRTLTSYVQRLSHSMGIGLAVGFVCLQSLWLQLGISAFPVSGEPDPDYCQGAGKAGDDGTGTPGHSQQDCDHCPLCQSARMGAGAPLLASVVVEMPRPNWSRQSWSAAAVTEDARPSYRQTPLARAPPDKPGRRGGVDPNLRHPVFPA